MTAAQLHLLAVVGSLQRNSALAAVVDYLAAEFRAAGATVDVLDLQNEPLALFNPETTRRLPEYPTLQTRVERADVIVLATPDYHGSISGAMKNFLDHFWHEFCGKLFVPLVASHDKGLTTIDQLRTVARQCYAWTLPYGISFASDLDVKDGQITSDSFKARLEMTIRDSRVYGGLLARQRRQDLIGAGPGFLAKHRK